MGCGHGERAWVAASVYSDSLMLSVQEVSKSYGRFQAVTGVSFALEAGEIAGLLGPNGAGKTTTIRMITGFLPPDRGAITVCGHDTVSASIEARRRIGYLPESAPLHPEMTPRGYLAFRAALYGMPRRGRAAAIGRVIERCWLGDVANKRIGKLSKGYRQRVGLASALLHDPKVLVLDEPTNALDPTQVRETRGLIGELARDRVVLLSSHILSEVEIVCSRVIVMARGRIRADGTPAGLTRSRGGAVAGGVAGGGVGACVARWRFDSAESDERVFAALRGLPGAGSVSEESARPGPGSAERGAMIEALPGADSSDLMEAVGGVLTGCGVRVRALEWRGMTLERLFVDLVERDPDDREGA